VDSSLNLIEKFIFPSDLDFIETTYHDMVFRRKNDEELISCLSLNYYLKAVCLPKQIIFNDKFKYFGEAYFWSRIKNVQIRYLKEPLRVYHNDSGNSIINNTTIETGMYNDIVSFKYFLDLNFSYLLNRPKYFISQYVKLCIASKYVGFGFYKSHFLYDKLQNRIISLVLFPIIFLIYHKMKYIDKRFWR